MWLATGPAYGPLQRLDRIIIIIIFIRLKHKHTKKYQRQAARKHKHPSTLAALTTK